MAAARFIVFFCCLVVDVLGKKNVLFLVSDDLRPELGMYHGRDAPSPVHPRVHTPNLNALSRKSLLLKRAYVQQALCSPSRTSLLTGRRPDTTHVYDLFDYFRVVGGNFTTIPEYFKMHGYRTIGVGKIFHSGEASGWDDPISWTDPYVQVPPVREYKDGNSWRAVPESEWSQVPLRDTRIANQGIEAPRKVAAKAKSGEQPFFVAVGMHKPHLPFVFPDKFLKDYPEDSVQLPPNPYAPKDMPPIAWSTYHELISYNDISALNVNGAIDTTLPNDTVLALRRAYYSAVTYMDYEMGRVLDELDNLGLANNTIVSFFGDHGWQLGEHGEWCKHTNFEIATHAPMMIHVPGLTDDGIVTERLTEFVDLFPTLAEAAGLPPLPECPVHSADVGLCREGTSLVPLMKDPRAKWKTAAFSQYPRRNSRIMGYTMRTERHRYTEWVRFNEYPFYEPKWDTLFGIELYDHRTDPEENVNLINDARHSHLRHQLRNQLRAGWRSAVPGSKICDVIFLFDCSYVIALIKNISAFNTVLKGNSFIITT